MQLTASKSGQLDRLLEKFSHNKFHSSFLTQTRTFPPIDQMPGRINYNPLSPTPLFGYSYLYGSWFSTMSQANNLLQISPVLLINASSRQQYLEHQDSYLRRIACDIFHVSNVSTFQGC